MDFTQLRDRLAPRYELIEEIGRGGMGVVYLARDVQHDRRVAIKLLHEEISAVLGHERFRREIEFGSKLSHPNILQILDSGQIDELLYCVMPFIPGESLRTRLRRERQLPIDEAVRIGCEIAAALDFAHRKGVVHRDIKPENVLLTEGRAVVADFGIARAINSVGDERLTHSGVTLGTPLYMSPEQASADSELDGRSDIYSLACCVYEMLVGSPPFTGPTSQVIMARHALDQAPSLAVARQTVPPHVAAAVMRGLAKAPVDRFRTAAEFGDALSGRVRVEMPWISGPVPATPPPASRRSRRPLYLGVTAAVLIAALATQRYWLTPKRAAASGVGFDATTIAVMYLDDRSDGRLAYLADGLTEALIDRLSEVRSLNVISANGVRPYRGEDVPPESVARSLGAGTVVRGSIEGTRGDSVRVIVRLVDGASGVDFKSTTLAGSAKDPLRLRDDLSQRAAEFLRARLGEQIHLQAQRAETRNADAWSLVQQAEHAKKEAESQMAADSVDAATARFARADSLLAEAERLDTEWSEPPNARGSLAYAQARLVSDRTRAGQLIATGLAHVERAIVLDPRSADALELRGTLRYLRWLLSLEADPTRAAQLLKDAEADLRAAVSISPSNAAAWSALSHLNYQKPDFTEAKLAALRAYQEDAYLSAAPDIVWRLYTTSYDLEDFAGAAQWCTEGQRRFAANPRFVECRLWLMTARGSRPDIATAWSLVDSVRARVPADQWPPYKLAVETIVGAVIARAAAVDSANRVVLADSARHVLQAAKASREMDPEGELLGFQAFARTLLGDKEDAFRLLKEYFAINPSHRALFAKGNSWWWRPLMDDPRFEELVGFQRR
jgi:serine/threonine-protein kinase